MSRDSQRTPSGRVSRRGFLQSAAVAAGAFAAPQIVPASVFGAFAPSNRVAVGVIGCGNQSTIDLPAFLGHDECQVVAVCDVNTASHGYRDAKQFLGRKVQQEAVNKFYAEKTGAGQYKGCNAYTDFREVLGRKDIDAVAIIVPDHWHAYMTIRACEAGKDIYCEKPLSLTIDHGKRMVKAVRQHKRILQTGSHWRSCPNARQACELVRNGRLGQLKRIDCYIPKNNAEDPGPGWKPMPVPEGFDYEMWLGPAPAVPYHQDRCFYRFRFIMDYSGGQTTNFGAHTFDIAQWGHGSDGAPPVEYEDQGAEWPPKGSLFSTPTKVLFRAKYADGVELTCQTEGTRFGVTFIGTEGKLEFGYKGFETTPKSLKDYKPGANDIRLQLSNPKRLKDEGSKLYIPDHVGNFLAAVKSRQDPIEPVEIGHCTATICHVANITMKLKRKLKWDAAKEQFLGDDEANSMLSRPMRAPWQL